MKKEQPRRTDPRACPICKKPVKESGLSFPFCSDRCRTIDLAKWARGDYAISRPIQQTDLDDT